jgi:hypothetical protein
MYLDEDTLGFFNENDINRVLMDRFCYGLKWMYRSAVSVPSLTIPHHVSPQT